MLRNQVDRTDQLIAYDDTIDQLRDQDTNIKRDATIDRMGSHDDTIEHLREMLTSTDLWEEFLLLSLIPIPHDLVHCQIGMGPVTKGNRCTDSAHFFQYHAVVHVAQRQASIFL